VEPGKEEYSLAFFPVFVEAGEPDPDLLIFTGRGGGGLEGGGAAVGCVKRGISDTVSHTSSYDSKFSSYFGDISA
jgi:hypothetical protein